MEIGMMPSKLAHQMVNMGVGLVEIEKRKNPDTVTVWDPLCGFGTTNFVAHAL
jgi:type I restriction-modification system DNA methylase subunit